MIPWRKPQPVTCQHCDGKSGHPPIEGDGPPVCYPCLIRLGRYAAENTSLQRRLDEAAIQRRLAAFGDDEVAA